MTISEHFEALSAPQDDDLNLTPFRRFQRRTQRAALDLELSPRGPAAPTWGHLAARTVLLACEGAIRLRWWLLFLAPFITGAVVIANR